MVEYVYICVCMYLIMMWSMQIFQRCDLSSVCRIRHGRSRRRRRKRFDGWGGVDYSADDGGGCFLVAKYGWRDVHYMYINCVCWEGDQTAAAAVRRWSSNHLSYVCAVILLIYIVACARWIQPLIVQPTQHSTHFISREIFSSCKALADTAGVWYLQKTI